MPRHGSVRIELQEVEARKTVDPKLKRVKKEIQDREYILKLNIRTPFSQSIHIQIGAKGRNNVLPFHPQNRRLANKIDSAQSFKKGNSLHSIVKGMVGQRKRKVMGEQLAFEIPWVMGTKAATGKAVILQFPS